MTNIEKLLRSANKSAACVVFKPQGLPEIPDGFTLPEDVAQFYTLCGGISLYTDSVYSFTIVPPSEFQLANPVIVGELCEDDISSKWFIVCKDEENNYITIDLSEERNGRCYDSFWDRHGVVGECSIVAHSFTELLDSLISNKGKSIINDLRSFRFCGVSCG